MAAMMHVDQGEAGSHEVHEPAQLQVRGPIAAERGRGGQQHDDGRLDHQGEGKDQTSVGGQVDGGVGQAGDDRGDGGALEAHEDPAGGERPPGAEDAALAEGPGVAAAVGGGAGGAMAAGGARHTGRRQRRGCRGLSTRMLELRPYWCGSDILAEQYWPTGRRINAARIGL